MSPSKVWKETEGLLPVLPGSPSFLHIFLATVPGPTANLLLSYFAVLMSLGRAGTLSDWGEEYKHVCL